MARSLGQTIAFGALAALIAVASAMPQAVAVEEMRQFNKDDGKKAGNTKSCPSGQRYSEKKRGCIKTSCGTGQVWSSGVEACLDGNSASLSDDDLYLAGRDLGQQAHYAEALKFFFRMKNREQARVLSSIGYSTRKLGDVDKGIDYYHQALAIDSNFIKARQYLGEAYLQKGDVEKAKEQLMEIADRCGGPCDDYELLVKAIAAHVTGENNTAWQF
jgi:tetratricopeptide (TPR) repeat protein